MTLKHDTTRQPHFRAQGSTERRRFEALRSTIETLWTMNIPEDKLKLTYRVDRNRLMAFGLSMKMVADVSHSIGSIAMREMKYMNCGELQREIEKILKTRKLSFTTYELDMKKFLFMRKSRPQYADIFAACNSELFPSHERGITVEMYAMKYGLNEKEVGDMLDRAEAELLIKVD